MLVAIAAVADNGIIGINNKLPWHISADMALFKELTTNNPVIMGRKTFEALGRPLPNRPNIIISKTLRPSDVPDAYVFNNIRYVQMFADIPSVSAYVIGGTNIYAQLLPLCAYLRITRVHLNPEGDAYFPEYKHMFKIISKEPRVENDIDFDFEIHERINNKE